MKIYTPIGSKERLFEIMKGVNNVELNESYSSGNVLEMAFKELKTSQLEVEPQDTGDENIVNLLGTDRQGNTVSFTFHIEFTDDVQDNVFEVTNAKLISFAFDDAMGGESVEMGENELQQFNASHVNDMIEIAGNYVDYNQVQVGQPEEIDELYEEAIKKIDSYPFGGTPERMQTSRAYGDEKPTNASVRVKSPELNKFEFVDEGIGIKPDTDNVAQKYSNNLDPNIKKIAIEIAKKMVDDELERRGMKSFDISPEIYRAKIKELAVVEYEKHLTSLNEEETKEKGDYPDQIGKKFKPKNQIPKKKKKPQSVVKLGEQYMEDDLDIPVDKNATNVAKSDIYNDIRKQNGTKPISYNTTFAEFAEGYEEELTPEENPEVTNDAGMKNDDMLAGGLADDKEPKDFDSEQLAMGLKVEMEHTDDPKVALEIAMDHLMEIPDYYTHLDKMEKDAGAEGDDDLQMTDRLLGYEPKNVGDEIKLDEEDDLFARMGDIFRPETGSRPSGNTLQSKTNNLVREASGGNKTKMFKIGEYAIGGIIKVDIDTKSGVQGGEVAISALDWNTKRPVQGTRFVASNFNGIDDYLNELTSSYYAEMVMKWIKENLGASSKPDYFSNQNW